jgi:hypothetical protein
MMSSPAIGQIGKALSAAQGKLKGAVKDSNNPFFKSKYADLSSVWDACRDALAENNIAVIQGPMADGSKITVTTLLVHESGEWVSEALTSHAKDDSPQSVGSTITYLRRYGLASMVGVAPEDDDAEAAQPRGTTQGRGIPHQPIPSPAVAMAATKAKIDPMVKERVAVLVKLYGDNFKAYAERVLRREVHKASDLTLDDILKLEQGEDVP